MVSYRMHSTCALCPYLSFFGNLTSLHAFPQSQLRNTELYSTPGLCSGWLETKWHCLELFNIDITGCDAIFRCWAKNWGKHIDVLEVGGEGCDIFTLNIRQQTRGSDSLDMSVSVLEILCLLTGQRKTEENETVIQTEQCPLRDVHRENHIMNFRAKRGHSIPSAPDSALHKHWLEHKKKTSHCLDIQAFIGRKD